MLQAAFGGVSPCYQVKSSLSTALRHLTKEFLCEVIFKKEARLMVRWQYRKTRERPIAHQSFGREPDLCNAIWSDIYIESTFMRYGHSPGGIIGITVKPSTLKRWALSLHLCSQIVRDVSEMKDESRKVSVTLNKVEIAARNHSAAVLLFCDLK